MTVAGQPLTIKISDPHNDDGVVLNNTNATAAITIRTLAGAVVVASTPMIWDIVYLRWEYQWNTTGQTAGHYRAQVDLLPTGALAATTRWLDLELQTAPGPSVALSSSPCDPWPCDLCCATAGVDQTIVDRMIMAATEVYWGLSGRQFGVCTIPPLRPCRRDCFDATGWTEWYGGNPYMPGPFIPASSGGLYFNLTCGACIGDCSCDALEEIALPSPVAEVVQVKIDGVVLAPSAYRVDNWNTLVRIDGGVFPTCQTMHLADTEVGTMSVAVKVGKQVPVLGELAVAELACELIAGCSEPNECLVPAHIVARTRAGVSESFIDLADIVQYKLTGLPAGDYFLRTFNPSGLSSRSSVHSPDYRPARRAGT